MIVQKVVAVLQLEDLLKARRVDALPVARERLSSLRLGRVVLAQRQWSLPLGLWRFRCKVPLLLLHNLLGLHLED